ncbi:MAG: hypothetical protein RL189_2354 [Pseudomonadota bacterium]
MKIYALLLVIALSDVSVCSAAPIHKLDVASYLAQFSTSFGKSERKVLSPLGLLVQYAYRMDMQTSFFGNFSTLHSGQGSILNGISGGIDYAIFGGQPHSYIIQKNTGFNYSFPIRIGLFSGFTIRGYDLTPLYPGAAKFSLAQNVPDKGFILGFEPGISVEGILSGRFKYSACVSYTFPHFITNSEQKGRIISMSTGIGTQL